MLRRIAQVAGVIVAMLVAFAAYMGLFSSVRILESEEGPFVFVYREMSGTDMQQVARITTELHGLLTKAGVSGNPFDVFQPQDSGKPHEIGFVIAEPDLARVQAEDKSLGTRAIPRQLYMKAEFPFRNRFSFIAGYMKVDPALAAYRAAHGFVTAPAIARNDGETITYLQPVVRSTAKN